MRVILLGFLLITTGCRDHKRANSFDQKPEANSAAPYSGVPQNEQKK